MWASGLAALLTELPPGQAAFDHVARAPLVLPSMTPRPGYLQSATDAAFGTSFIRITDPGREMIPGVACMAAYCTHRYSSAQAWNADQTLLVIANGCQGLCFLDGRTYRPLFHRHVADECEWHPTNPDLMICVEANRLYQWAPRSDTKALLYAPNGYSNLQFGPFKGNPSNDGHRLVLRATNRASRSIAFAYDIAAMKRYPDIALDKLPGKNGYCTISPSGRFIACFQTTIGGVETAFIFTIDGVLLRHWDEHHRPGHGDMTLDADGHDVYVGISKADPDKYHVIKRRLEDGAVTDLVPYGEAQHASIRNTNLPGWVFLTFAGTHSEIAAHPSWAPFYQEVIALRIDGSGSVRRIVQTRNATYDYWSEAHASPSPDGTQVIWSSNWGHAGGPVADFVATVPWQESDFTARPPH